MLPAINDFLSLGEQVLEKVGAWIEENQELVRVIMMIVLGIGGFLTIGGAALTVIGGIGLAVTRAAALGKTRLMHELCKCPHWCQNSTRLHSSVISLNVSHIL